MRQAESASLEVVRDIVEFRGHAMVRSLHPTTIEVTAEEHLTEKGDCILGVGASKGCLGLDERVKARIRTPGSQVTITFRAGGESFLVHARGDPRLVLDHPHDMVIRRSDFASDRTLALGADASARDVPRRMVALLKDPRTIGHMEIEVR